MVVSRLMRLGIFALRRQLLGEPEHRSAKGIGITRVHILPPPSKHMRHCSRRNPRLKTKPADGASCKPNEFREFRNNLCFHEFDNYKSNQNGQFIFSTIPQGNRYDCSHMIWNNHERITV